MRRVSQGVSLVFFAIGAFAVWESLSLRYYVELGPGSGFFPFWLGVALAVLGIVWLGQVSLQVPAVADEPFLPERAGVMRLLAILVALVAFGTLVETIGYQLMAFAFLLFLLVALGRQNRALTLALSVLGSFGLYYAFKLWLNVHLPTASVEFLRNLGF